MLRQLQAVKMELRKRMHDPIAKTGAWLTQMLKGHLNYYAVSGNSPSLWWYFNEVLDAVLVNGGRCVSHVTLRARRYRNACSSLVAPRGSQCQPASSTASFMRRLVRPESRTV